MDTKLKNFIINTLRKASFRHKSRGEAKKRFRVPNGFFKNGNPKYGYQCAKCVETFMSKHVEMDHLHSVVHPIRGFEGFDVYIPRMFCEEMGWICLCDPCHTEKTSIEKDFRVKSRQLIKDDQSTDKLDDEYIEFLSGYNLEAVEK